MSNNVTPMIDSRQRIVEVDIERYADQGRCVAHVDGKVVFVRFALPGERVRIALDLEKQRKNRFFTGEVIEVIQGSEYRVEPIWRIAGPLAWGGGLGGADLVHANLEGQRAWKAAMVTEQMQRLGGLKDLPLVPISYADDEEVYGGLHWRTRMDLVVGKSGVLSMRKRGSHELVPLASMPLATRSVLAIAQQCNAFLHAHSKLQHNAYATSRNASMSVIAGDRSAVDNAFLDDSALRDAFADVFSSVSKSLSLESSVMSNHNLTSGNTLRFAVPWREEYRDLELAIDAFEQKGQAQEALQATKELLAAIGDNFTVAESVVTKGHQHSPRSSVIAGRQYVDEIVTVAGHKFHYEVNGEGFWQIHRQAPALLGNYVVSLLQEWLAEHGFVNGEKRLRSCWDLYSGSGLFTMMLAQLIMPSDGRVVGIEGAPKAVESARKNMKRAGLDNVHEYCGDVEKTLRMLPAEEQHPDFVVLDPPRAGARRAVCEQIAASGASCVVYVACDPASVSRDVGTLRELGYRVDSVRAFDIYPMTHHVETVVLMSRA